MIKITYYFDSKEEFKETIKYFGEPPCLECIVQATCYNEIESDHFYELILNDECVEMRNWVIESRKNYLKKRLERIDTEHENIINKIH